MAELTAAIAASTVTADIGAIAAFVFGAGVLVYGVRRVRSFLKA